jgi:DNA polymerase III sliding clamp (beta) subunit (PCNA family)
MESMKFTIAKKHLMSALNLTKYISKAAPLDKQNRKKVHMLYGDYTTIKSYKSGYVRITASNDDTQSYISCKRPAVVSAADYIMKLKTKELLHIIKLLPVGDLSFCDNGDNIVIKMGDISAILSHNNIMTMKPDRLKKGKNFTQINTDIFRKMIDMTSFSISKDKTRPHIGGALLQKEGGFLRMVTTDGHRLSRVEVKTRMRCDNFSIKIPRRCITELKRLFAIKNSDIVVGFNEYKFFITTKNAKDKTENMLIVKLGDPEFVNADRYKYLFKDNIEQRITVNTKALLSAVKRCTPMGLKMFSSYQGIKLNVSAADKLNINLEKGLIVPVGMSEAVPARCSISTKHIHVNPQYLADVLKVINTAGVTIDVFKDFIAVVDFKNNFNCIIMMIRD